MARARSAGGAVRPEATEEPRMSKLDELIRKDDEMIERDEPSPPNAERHGLWRLLVVGTALAVVALAIAAWAILG